MERISKDLIRKGIANSVITFGTEDDMMVAHIGDYWFFVPAEDGKTRDDFSMDELADMVHASINDEPINGEDEDDASECLYYLAILSENCE